MNKIQLQTNEEDCEQKKTMEKKKHSFEKQ